MHAVDERVPVADLADADRDLSEDSRYVFWLNQSARGGFVPALTVKAATISLARRQGF